MRNDDEQQQQAFGQPKKSRAGSAGMDSLPPPPSSFHVRGKASPEVSRPLQTPRRTSSGIPPTTPSNHRLSSPGASQVGAVAVRGIDVDNIPVGDEDNSMIDVSTVIIGDDNEHHANEPVVAEAVTRDDHIASELRETLRNEIQQEVRAQLRNSVQTAEVVDASSSLQSGGGSAAVPLGNENNDDKNASKPPPPPLWQRKPCLLTALVMMVIAAAIVGALFGTGTLSVGNEEAQPAPAVGGGQNPPPTAPPTTATPVVDGGAAPPTSPTSPPPPPGEPTAAPTLSPTLPPIDTLFPLSFPQTLEGDSNGDNFGDFVVLSRDGSTMAVGATDGNYVQVFRRNGNNVWTRIGETIAGSGSGGDQFGRSLDLSQDGSMLVVGAWNNDDAAENSGHAQVFRFDGSTWNQVGSTLTGDAASDRFGWYVSMSNDGNTIAASARLGDPNGVQDAGYTRVFTLVGGDWSQLGPDLQGQEAEGQFGRSLALDSTGRRLAVGAVRGGGGNGRVQIFDFTFDEWKQVGQDLDGDNSLDFQGTSVALSEDGSFVAIGADGADINGSESGMVRVYRLDGTTWIQQGQNILGENAADQFGAGHISMSSDGSCVSIGANHFNNDTGKGYLYKWNGSEWTLAAEIEGNSAEDRFGDSATVSGDCDWIAWGGFESNDGPGYVDVFQVG